MKLKFIVDKKLDKLDLDSCQSEFVRQNFDDVFKYDKKYVYQTCKLYQESWDEINDVFSRYIEKQTGYKWYYDEYNCVVSIANAGLSNWGHEPVIVRGWKENPYMQRRVTAHELILSHYFEIYRRNYSDQGLTDGQVWALAEIAAFALTTIPKEIRKFWPWFWAGSSVLEDHPNIIKLQMKLKESFINRKNFDEYIMTGIKLIRPYKNISPEVRS